MVLAWYFILLVLFLCLLSLVWNCRFCILWLSMQLLIVFHHHIKLIRVSMRLVVWDSWAWRMVVWHSGTGDPAIGDSRIRQVMIGDSRTKWVMIGDCRTRWVMIADSGARLVRIV